MNPRQAIAERKKQQRQFISYRGNKYSGKFNQDFEVFYGDGFLEVTQNNTTTKIQTWGVPEIEVEANLELLGFTCIYRHKIH